MAQTSLAMALERLKHQRSRAEVTLAWYLSDAGVKASQKLSFVGKGIARIGDGILPAHYEETKLLYLSRNRLVSLDGVQQFTNLRAFSAADNFLGSLVAVAPLAPLPSLEAVSLDGNPVIDVPNYRAHMITMLSPSLRQLDGKAVGPGERETAAAIVAFEEAVRGLAADTENLMHAVDRSSKLDAIHAELFKRDRRAAAVARVAAWWAPAVAPGGSNLTSDVCSIYDRLLRGGKPAGPATWHAAFCRALADQAAALEAALGSLEAGSEASWAASSVKLRQALQEVAALDPTAATSADAARDVRRRVRGLHAEMLAAIASTEVNKQHKHDDADDWRIAASGAPPSPSKRRCTSNKAPLTPTRAAKAREEATTLAAQHVIATEDNAWLRLALEQAEERAAGAEAVAAAASQRAEAADAALRLLQSEQGAAQDANASLQKWLEAANTAVEEGKRGREAAEANAATAAAECAALQARVAALEASLEDTRAAAALEADASAAVIGQLEAAAVEAQLRDAAMMAELRAAREAVLSAENAAEEAQEAAAAPVQLQISVFFAEELERERARSAALAAAAEAAEARAAATEAALEVTHSRIAQMKAVEEEKVEREAQRRARLEALEDAGLAQHARRVAAAGLAAWSIATQRSKRLNALQARIKAANAAAALQQWRSAAQAAQLLRALQAAAAEAYQVSLLRKMLQKWRLIAEIYSQIDLPEDSPQLNAAASGRHRRALSATFSAWRRAAQAAAAKSDATELLVSTQAAVRLQAAALEAWRAAVAAGREDAVAAQCGDAARALLLGRRVLRTWRSNARLSAEATVDEAAAVAVDRRGTLGRAFAAWGEYHVQCRAEKAAQGVMEEARGMAAMREAWAVQMALQRSQARAAAAALETRSACFAAWRAETAVERHNRAILAFTASKQRRLGLARVLGGWRAAAAAGRAAALLRRVEEMEIAALMNEESVELVQAQILAMEKARAAAEARAEAVRAELAEAQAALESAEEEMEFGRKDVFELEAKLQSALEEQAAAEAAAVEAEAAAAAAAEARARAAAQQAADYAAEERERAAEEVRMAQAAAVAAKQAAIAAAQRAQEAEEARAEAEMMAMDALEGTAAASAALERVIEESEAVREGMAAERRRCRNLEDRLAEATAAEAEARAAGEALRGEAESLRRQLGAARLQWRAAEEARAEAESDAAAAVRHSERLSEMLEQRAAHQQLTAW